MAAAAKKDVGSGALFGLYYADERRQREADTIERFVSWLTRSGLLICEPEYGALDDTEILDAVRDYIRENC